jgi:Macrocin-O-methyltransferase (TylF)
MSTEILQRILKQLEVARTIPSTPLRLRERAVEDAVDYILANPRFDNVQVSRANVEALKVGLRATSLDGVVAEFGVFRGVSLTTIANYFSEQIVHGFDSFIGLPERWSGTDKEAGFFSVVGSPPNIPVSNVEFHVGFFDETVPAFAADMKLPFSFAHLDADLYSSTKTVLDALGEWFVPGTILVFDEYFGNHGWRNHEHRAFMAFLEGRAWTTRRSQSVIRISPYG